MPFFDFTQAELYEYRPKLNKPDDFDNFWQTALSEVGSVSTEFVSYDHYLKWINVYDVTFSGFVGQAIKGWFLCPKDIDTPVPCVIQYIGYGGGRGEPYDWLMWASAGYATFIMDTRGQGSVWRKGDTPDLPNGANPSHPGFMTQGILSPDTYYYKRVFVDAVCAVHAAKAHPTVDGSKIIVTGRSQGGGISLAVAGLVPDLLAVMPDVPFLCHFTRAVGLTDAKPYQEIVEYLHIHRDKVDTVFQTLSYFDGAHFASNITATSLFSVALMDNICPPSTVFAAYHQITTSKEIVIYPYNNHEGGETEQVIKQLAFVADLLKDA